MTSWNSTKLACTQQNVHITPFNWDILSVADPEFPRWGGVPTYNLAKYFQRPAHLPLDQPMFVIFVLYYGDDLSLKNIMKL